MKCNVAFVLAVVLAAAGLAGAQEPWKDYNRGIRWEKSLDEAKVRAAREGKPILFHQLVGDLDKEGC